MQTYHYGDIYCRFYSSFQRKAEQSFPFTKAKQARGGSPAQGRGNATHTRYARSHRQGRAKAQEKGGTDEEAIPQETDRHREAVRRRYYDTAEIEVLPRYLCRGDGLQRGIDGSKARHKSTQQYYRDIQKLADNLKAEVVDLQQQKETAREELRRAKKEIQTEKLKRAATTAAANIAKSVGSLFGSNKVKTLERENTALHREVADHEETIEACKIGYSPCRQTTAGRYGKCSRGTAGK